MWDCCSRGPGSIIEHYPALVLLYMSLSVCCMSLDLSVVCNMCHTVVQSVGLPVQLPSHLLHKRILLAADSQAKLAAVFRLSATPRPQSQIVSLACRMIWLTWIQYSCSCSSRATLNVSFYGKTVACHQER